LFAFALAIAERSEPMPESAVRRYGNERQVVDRGFECAEVRRRADLAVAPGKISRR
jgi:hypothetical protein